MSILCRVIVKVCTCEHGVAQSGVQCPASGVAKCKSCHPGRTINPDRTKCICTWTRTAINLFARIAARLWLRAHVHRNSQWSGARARTVWQKLDQVAQLTALRSASRAILVIKRTKKEPNVSVRLYRLDITECTVVRCIFVVLCSDSNYECQVWKRCTLQNFLTHDVQIRVFLLLNVQPTHCTHSLPQVSWS